MPSATDELRNKMNTYFGDSIDEQGPMKFLRDNGWKLDRNWVYHTPTFSYEANEKEIDCITFLAQEWDFAYTYTSDQALD